jgi:natural product precursor
VFNQNQQIMLKKKLKLSTLSDSMLKDKEMVAIFGGEGRICGCSCAFEDQGGSTSEDNSAANYKLGEDGGHSSTGCNNYVTYAGEYYDFTSMGVKESY